MNPPLFLTKLFTSLTWRIPVKEKILFLTFDDGPIPNVTERVLDLLNDYNAKATFFCIGENIENNPEIFNRIIESGHAVGNHTYNHLNGWKTLTPLYIENVDRCNSLFQVRNQNEAAKPLFRPPYGKIKLSQYTALKKNFSIIMWDVVTRDWEQNRTADSCFERIKRKAKPGSIIVFHDSIKAQDRMIPALERTLQYFSSLGYQFQPVKIFAE